MRRTSVLHYQLVDPEAFGEPGSRVRAVDTRRGRLVCVLTPPGTDALEPDARRRWLDEARAASALDHPNLGALHAVEEAEDGRPFLVVDPLRGTSLQARLAEGALPLTDALDVAQQMALGLAAAHAAGVVHRALEPGRVLLCDDGRVEILDVGFPPRDRTAEIGDAGAEPATLAYLAPEQVAGRQVDARADLWAWGAIVYETFTGTAPFRADGGGVAEILRIVSHDPPPADAVRPEVPPALSALLARVLAKDPARRPGSAAELIAELEGLRSELGAPARGGAVPAPSPVVPEPDAGGVLISYRRADTSGYAGRIFDDLVDRFGRERIFMDIQTIEPGADFIDAIEDALRDCRVLVALIGRSWATIADVQGDSRLHRPDDVVRMEVASALRLGIKVLPVLVGGAAMPGASELPEDLQRLSRINALELTDKRWRFDLDRLGASLERFGVPPAEPDPALGAESQVSIDVPRDAIPEPAPEAVADPAPQPLRALPRAKTALVGRHDELALVASHLSDPLCRVLTLVGPGGTGKTRLATEAGRQALDAELFSDGVVFVPLEVLDDPDRIVEAIAQAFALPESERAPTVELVAGLIGARELLLILDNYEQVMDGAEIPAELIGACPNLKILVTSRERLNLDEEWVVPLPGLGVPPEAGAGAEAAQRHPAVELFVQRARRADARFELGDADAAHVARICRLVAGSPLAIELAAAWVDAMPCAEIAREIEATIDFLESRSRNARERHRSLRACFEYSWALLNPAERDAVRRLSLFQGGFDRSAADAVAGVRLPTLTSLLDKSLLGAEAGRYANHPLLRQYAAEKLAEDPDERARVEAAHGAYYLRFLQACGEAADGMERLEGELANVLAATQAAADRGDDRTLAAFMELLALEDGYYQARGHTPRSLELLREAIEAAKRLGETLLAHRLLSKLGNTYKHSLGDLHATVQAYFEALELAEQLGNQRRQAVVLSAIGQTRFEQGEDDADGYLERAQEAALDCGDGLALNHVLQHRGFVAGARGDWTSARRLFSEAIDALDEFVPETPNERAKADYQTFIGLLNFGEAERNLENHAVALEFRRRALAMAEAHNNRVWEAYAHHELGEVYHDVGDRERARASFERALELLRRSHNVVETRKLEAFLAAEGYLAETAPETALGEAPASQPKG